MFTSTYLHKLDGCWYLVGLSEVYVAVYLHIGTVKVTNGGAVSTPRCHLIG